MVLNYSGYIALWEVKRVAKAARYYDGMFSSLMGSQYFKYDLRQT
jgi:hypothetical protein